MRNVATPVKKLKTKKQSIDYRAEVIGEYVAQTGCTVRDAAKEFGVSKSTVHKDITERLAKINPELACETQAVLFTNKSERHLRGGKATKLTYAKRRARKD